MNALRVLQIEDDEDHALLIEKELQRGGYQTQCTRVDTVEELRAKLTAQAFDLITSDFGLPRFDAPSALSVVHEFPVGEVPFIIVSGTIPDTAVGAAMKAGAHDFVSKSDLKRLVPAVRRELKEAASRRRRRLAEARFRTLACSLDGVVVALDRDLRIDAVYGRGLRGASAPVELIGQPVGELFRPQELADVEAACHRLLDAPDAATQDAVLELDRTSHGQASLIEATISPLLEPDGTVIGLLGFLRDVTEQRKLQAQVVVSDRMATIGTLAAGVAHEINNPLSALLSNLHMVSRDVDRLLGGHLATPTFLAELREIVTDANAAAAMVLTIAGDLRTFSRQSHEEPGPVSLRRVLESALRMARNQLSRARVVRDYADVPPALGVESALGQVFLNLLVNAAQALPDDGREDHQVSVGLAHDPAREQVVVQVRDTGHGMSPAVLDRLFVPFFTTKPSGVGTGLGLSICRRIVEGFGGTIVATSREGEGATFTVRLPCAPHEEAP
jgi:PAS domain S-box-containing protein